MTRAALEIEIVGDQGIAPGPRDVQTLRALPPVHAPTYTRRRLGQHYLRRRFLANDGSSRRVLLIGNGKSAAEFATFVDERPWLGVRCVGAISPDTTLDAALRSRSGNLVPCVGSIRDVERALADQRAEEFILALDREDNGRIHAVTQVLARGRLPFRVVPSLFPEAYRSAELAGFEELPVLDMAVDPLDRAKRFFKRVLDIGVAVLSLLVALPVLAACALAVKTTSEGPVLLRQERVGRNGRRFEMLKFRTMVAQAEDLLPMLRPLNEADGLFFKMKLDPRITKVGGFLRTWSLDELPQLINVIRGEMSLVGPRPALPAEVERYGNEHLHRLRGQPGITGLWQVSGRSDLSFEQMVHLDLHYLDTWSPLLDLKILFRTVYAVLARRGAY